MAEKRRDSKGRVLKTGESQRKDGTYMYRYTELNGKRRAIYAPTLKELREKSAQIFVAKTEGRYTPPSNVTVKELLPKYAKLYRHRRENTVNTYAYCESVILKHDIAHMKIREIQTSFLKAWFIELHEKGYARNSIYQIRGFLKRLMDCAVEDGLLFKNPMSFKINFLPDDRKKRDALTPTEQKSLLEYARTQIKYEFMYDHMVVLLGTGLRAGEYFGLTHKDIDYDKRTISVSKQLKNDSHGPAKIIPTKTLSSNRIIPMSDDVCNALKRIESRNKKFKIVQFVGEHTGFIALNSIGKLQSPTTFNNALRVIIEKHNQNNELQLPKITAHVFRHTFATNMAHLGVTPNSLQYLMGHSNLKTTYGVYVHSNEEIARNDALKAFENARQA